MSTMASDQMSIASSHRRSRSHFEQRSIHFPPHHPIHQQQQEQQQEQERQLHQQQLHRLSGQPSLSPHRRHSHGNPHSPFRPEPEVPTPQAEERRRTPRFLGPYISVRNASILVLFFGMVLNLMAGISWAIYAAQLRDLTTRSEDEDDVDFEGGEGDARYTGDTMSLTAAYIMYAILAALMFCAAALNIYGIKVHSAAFAHGIRKHLLVTVGVETVGALAGFVVLCCASGAAMEFPYFVTLAILLVPVSLVMFKAQLFYQHLEYQREVDLERYRSDESEIDF